MKTSPASNGVSLDYICVATERLWYGKKCNHFLPLEEKLGANVIANGLALVVAGDVSSTASLSRAGIGAGPAKGNSFMIKKLLRHVVPAFIWNKLSAVKQSKLIRMTPPRELQQSMESAGYTIARINDYYSPLPSVSHLKARVNRWYRPSGLRGIEYDLEGMKAAFSNLIPLYLNEFLAFPTYEQLQKEGFGPGYTALDALTLYMMIRHIKPRRYIEVGSGLSTYYCSLAARKNTSEGHPLQMTCIEPNPFAKLYTIEGIQIVAKEVQDVEMSLFQQLESNDVFFIDSSHILKVDGDVPFLFLEVLPALKVGAAIHIHDVPFPFNFPYPPERWIFGEAWPMFWNEAMIVQAFLCLNSKFKIEMSTPLIRHLDEEFLVKNVPFYQSIRENSNTFSSIWLKRLA